MQTQSLGAFLLQEIEEAVARDSDSCDERWDSDMPVQLDSYGQPHHVADVLWSPDGSYADATCERSYGESFAEQCVQHQETAWHVRRCLARLHPREEALLKLRFGIGHEDDLTYADVGQWLNMSRDQVRQIELRAMQRLISLLNCGMLGFSSKQVQQARERLTPVKKVHKKPKPEEPADILRRLNRPSFVHPLDKQLLLQLFGWEGVERKEFETLAEARGMTEHALAQHVNQLMRQLRRLGIWQKAPVFYPKRKNA